MEIKQNDPQLLEIVECHVNTMIERYKGAMMTEVVNCGLRPDETIILKDENGLSIALTVENIFNNIQSYIAKNNAIEIIRMLLKTNTLK